jgi:hypothetical protein
MSGLFGGNDPAPVAPTPPPRPLTLAIAPDKNGKFDDPNLLWFRRSQAMGGRETRPDGTGLGPNPWIGDPNNPNSGWGRTTLGGG